MAIFVTDEVNLPKLFQKLYHNMRVIINCPEVFMETPIPPVGQACLYDRHHCTVKFLVAITPNGTLSWISPTDGGQTSDLFIVWDSGLVDILEIGDQVMADLTFIIKTDLPMKQCKLCVPPSTAIENRMTSNDVKKY